MSRSQVTLAALVAVLVFWGVGAYNRMMRLRNALLSGYLPVDQQLKLRHTLLQRQAQALLPLLPEHAETLFALQAACTQAQAASTLARAHPGAANALGSLRLAESILLETRARLAAADGPEALSAETAEMAELTAQLAVVEAALQFARGRFNGAVMEYNHAVEQFPTRLLAGLFGFRLAGTL